MIPKDGLYYPYINVRNVNWLKATLLCFPHVLRMVPQGYIRNEPSEMREFAEILGTSNRPLLQAVNVREPQYEPVQHQFLNRLRSDFEQDPDFFIRVLLISLRNRLVTIRIGWCQFMRGSFITC